MYDVLVVDDESIICASLKSKISRLAVSESLPIRNVYTALSVSSALELLERHPVQILFTDIRMPEDCGLSVIRYAMAQDKPVQVVVISGHDDYSYVRNAFQLGVQDYLLKPAKSSTILEKLRLAIGSLEEEKSQKAHLQSQEFSILRYQLENHLNGHLKSLPVEAEQSMRALFPFGCFSVAVVYGRELSQTVAQVENYCQAQLGAFRLAVVPIQSGDGLCTLLLNGASQELAAEAQRFLRQLSRELAEEGPRLVCALGGQDARLARDCYARMYEEAVLALTSRLYRGEEPIYAYREQDGREIQEPDPLRSILNKAGEAFDNAQPDKIEPLIRQLTDALAQKSSAAACMQAYRFMQERFQEALKALGHPPEAPTPVYQFAHFSEMHRRLAELCQAWRTALSTHFCRDKQIINLVKKHIDDHYAEEITMAELSNLAAVSYNYFSRLFKNQVGKTFPEYLTEYRMRRALLLLEEPSLQIQEVAARVGYQSIYSFSRAFKRCYGVSPLKYRSDEGGGPLCDREC